MNDEQFEHAIGHFIPKIQEQLRARDTAQREALGRLVRKLDRERERADMAEVELQNARAAGRHCRPARHW